MVDILVNGAAGNFLANAEKISINGISNWNRYNMDIQYVLASL